MTAAVVLERAKVIAGGTTHRYHGAISLRGVKISPFRETTYPNVIHTAVTHTHTHTHTHTLLHAYNIVSHFQAMQCCDIHYTSYSTPNPTCFKQGSASSVLPIVAII